jgi:hypothetical protein
MHIYDRIFLTMRTVSDKSCRENQNTHFMFNFFFFSKIVQFMRCDNVEKYCRPDRPQIRIWRMHISCWVSKARNTHKEHVILTVFPLQLWLQVHASMLHYTYIACLVLHYLYTLKIANENILLIFCLYRILVIHFYFNIYPFRTEKSKRLT